MPASDPAFATDPPSDAAAPAEASAASPGAQAGAPYGAQANAQPAARHRELLVVSHTHWDREWYHPLAVFRQRLAALVRALLTAPDVPAPFLLDGQAVLLEDSVAADPALAAPLHDALARGALEAGPWYVLADERIPAGEVLVRNLLAGRRVLARAGARAPSVAWSPDAFGHPAALPAIAAGFGLPAVVLWRGYGGRRWPAGDTARWRAPDGSSVLLVHLPPDGYEFGSALPADDAGARARWRRIRDVLLPRARLPLLLLTHGADHHARQPDTVAAVAALARAATADDVHVRAASLSAWARAACAAAERTPLPEVAGELADSTGHAWSLAGTLATRAGDKRRAARADALLRWDVEPWLALAAWRHDAAGALGDAATATDVGTDAATDAALDTAWRTFLRAMPHDTLCGCSADEVARAMRGRLRSAAAQGRALREAALDRLTGRDAVAARALPREAWAPRLVIRNRVPHPRSGLVECVLDDTVGDVAVGPGGAGAPVPRAAPRGAGTSPASVVPAGLLVQPLGESVRHRRRESPQHYPDDDLVRRTRALAWLPRSHAVPAFGMRTLPLVAGRDENAPAASATDGTSAPAPARAGRDADGVTLDNGLVHVRASRRGVALRVRAGDGVPAVAIDDLLAVTWQEDRGDSYTPSPRGPVRRLPIARVRLLHHGPLRAACRVTFAARLPRRAAWPAEHDGTARVRRSRASGRCRLVVHVDLTLDAAASHLALHVRGTDRAEDHRLRLWCATGVPADHVVADAAFGWVARATPAMVAQRMREDAAACAPHEERRAAEEPLHRWIAVRADAPAHARRSADGPPLPSCTVLVADGLAESVVAMSPEAETTNATPRGSMATPIEATGTQTPPRDAMPAARGAAPAWLGVTLVRAIGALSRADLPERPGHAGWPTPMPGAQGMGPFRARFAIGWPAVPGRDARRDAKCADEATADVANADLAAAADQLADAVLRPLVGTTWRDATMDAPARIAGIALGGEGLRVTAIKPADDGRGLVLRAVNLRHASVAGAWRLPLAPGRGCVAHLARLDETPRRPLAVERTADGVRVACRVPPRTIVTVRVWCVPDAASAQSPSD